ncbi:hypothetical protein FB451DRAFT_1389801 [Mycena latifolia]|nr:hypothetical protein FB451DRAFT_1389801 [Mycena latifolia]
MKFVVLAFASLAFGAPVYNRESDATKREVAGATIDGMGMSENLVDSNNIGWVIDGNNDGWTVDGNNYYWNV